jgi:hypothetical protein
MQPRDVINGVSLVLEQELDGGQVCQVHLHTLGCSLADNP